MVSVSRSRKSCTGDTEFEPLGRGQRHHFPASTGVAVILPTTLLLFAATARA